MKSTMRSCSQVQSITGAIFVLFEQQTVGAHGPVMIGECLPKSFIEAPDLSSSEFI
jgi:hypothetical protein